MVCDIAKVKDLVRYGVSGSEQQVQLSVPYHRCTNRSTQAPSLNLTIYI